MVLGLMLAFWSRHEPVGIFEAIRRNDVARVRELIDDGCDPNTRNELRFSPLHLAAAYGATEVAEVLLTAGAVPNAKGPNDDTPLHCAARENKAEMIAFLIDHGADANARDSSGRTALHLAVAEIVCHDATEALLEKGALANATDVSGRTPLFDAVGVCNRPDIDLLLRYGGDLNIKDAHGVGLLDLAPEGSSMRAMVLKLLRTERDGEERNENGSSSEMRQ